MLSKNQVATLSCAALGSALEGVCRYEGQVVFVPGALPGETVTAVIVKTAKRHAFGKLTAVLEASPDRVAPPCPYYPRCGGCTAQHMAYGATLAHKRRQVADCLTRVGGFADPDVCETLGMADPWRYRNKGAFPVEGPAGAPRIGCFAGRSHRVVDAPEGCLLQSARSDSLVRAVRRWMTGHAVEPYDETARTGLIRHVVTREAADGGAMLVVVANGSALPRPQALVDAAREAVPSLRSVVLSENTLPTNVILGERFTTLWGEDALTDTFAGFSLRVSPRTFFQVNRPQAERLCQAALDFCGLTGGERVWDLYCGCGALTLPLARRAAWVTGVEIVPDAVADARENARRNGVANASFLAGATEAVLSELARQHAPDAVLLDPPRKGAEPEALAALIAAGPRRIVYISCNPATLARDAALLARGGYRLEGVQPVDMFGWTGHVETIVLLQRKDS